jgi:hypothetical protein
MGAMHRSMEAHKNELMRDGGAAEFARRIASSHQEMLAKQVGLDRAGLSSFHPNGPPAADMKHLTPEILYGMVNGSGLPRGMPPLHGPDQRMHSLYAGEPPHGYRTKSHA